MYFSPKRNLKEKWHFLPQVFCFPPTGQARELGQSPQQMGGPQGKANREGSEKLLDKPRGGSQTDGGLRLDPAVGGWAPNPESPPPSPTIWKPPKKRLFLPLQRDERNVQ